MDHRSDLLLVAMRRRLGYGYDEIAKGVPCPTPGPADAAPACTPAPNLADAPAASAGQPAPAQQCSSLCSAPDCTKQELTAVSGDLPVVQQSTPYAAAVVSLQQPGPQQGTAAMPTAAEAAALQPADGAQSPSQVPASDQPLCSATQETPLLDMQHSSMVEKQLCLPAADPLPAPPQSLQQAELAAACELPPQQGTMAGQHQDRQLTKATPAAATRPSAVVMPATAVQMAVAKPAVATPTTELPLLSDELLTRPPAASAAKAPGTGRAAGSKPATGLQPPGASHQKYLHASVYSTHLRNTSCHDRSTQCGLLPAGLTPEAQPAEQAQARPAVADGSLRQSCPPTLSPAVASLFQSQRMSFAASLDVALGGLGALCGSAKRHGAPAAPVAPRTASPAAPAAPFLTPGGPAAAPPPANIGQAAAQCHALDEAPQPAATTAGPAALSSPPAALSSPPMGIIGQFRARLCSSMDRQAAAVPRSAQRVANRASATPGTSPMFQRSARQQKKRKSEHRASLPSPMPQSSGEHGRRRTAAATVLALPATAAPADGDTPQATPPAAIEMRCRKRTPKPVQPFVAETSHEYNMRRQSSGEHGSRRRPAAAAAATVPVSPVPAAPAAGATMQATPPAAIELRCQKRTPKPAQPFVAETSREYNMRRQAEAASMTAGRSASQESSRQSRKRNRRKTQP